MSDGPEVQDTSSADPPWLRLRHSVFHQPYPLPEHLPFVCQQQLLDLHMLPNQRILRCECKGFSGMSSLMG